VRTRIDPDFRTGNSLKRIVWIAVVGFCLVCSPCFSQNKIEVIIREVKDGTGMIRVGLFTDAKTFLKKPIQGKVAKSTGGQQVVVFENVPSGSFAISVIHDSNENGKLDTSFFGIPKEGIGFSNDVMGSFGPPSFDKARFIVSSSITLTIRMRYL
jgi:uncharacterized protein (DUF2141 family)